MSNTTSELQQIRLVAVDSDGVLLNDTYSPVIERFVTEHGGVYTAEVERSVWGSPQLAAGQNMALACKLPWSAKDTIAVFFEERETYISEHPVLVADGAERLVKSLRQSGAQIVSYGGRDKAYSFDTYLGHLSEYFDGPKYIDVNDFRPGMKEIVADIYGYRYDEVLFIDDINRIAEVTKALGAGFIGVPASMPHNFQVQEMRETGVRFMVDSIDDIDMDLLRRTDAAMADGTMWRNEADSPAL